MTKARRSATRESPLASKSRTGIAYLPASFFGEIQLRIVVRICVPFVTFARCLMSCCIFKLHGSARPISMKSDVIRKRSRHDARRIGTGETPSASPGASRRASPAANQQASPTLAPDSSQLYYQDDYDVQEGYQSHYMTLLSNCRLALTL